MVRQWALSIPVRKTKHFLDLDGSESPAEAEGAYRRFEVVKRSLDAYFSEMREMLASEQKGEIAVAIKLAMQQINQLPHWARTFIAVYKVLDVGFPCVNLGVRYLPVLGRRDDADTLKQRIAKVPELVERYEILVAQMDEDFALAEKLRMFLAENPRSKQNRIGKLTGLSGKDVARLLQTMEKAGLVGRQKEGSTNTVTLLDPRQKER